MQKQLAHKRMIKNRVAAVVDLARWIHTPVACCRYCGTEAMDAFRHSLEGCVLISNVRNISEMPADVRCTSGFQTLVGSLVPCAATKKDYTGVERTSCRISCLQCTTSVLLEKFLQHIKKANGNTPSLNTKLYATQLTDKASINGMKCNPGTICILHGSFTSSLGALQCFEVSGLSKVTGRKQAKAMTFKNCCSCSFT